MYSFICSRARVKLSESMADTIVSGLIIPRSSTYHVQLVQVSLQLSRRVFRPRGTRTRMRCERKCPAVAPGECCSCKLYDLSRTNATVLYTSHNVTHYYYNNMLAIRLHRRRRISYPVTVIIQMSVSHLAAFAAAVAVALRV